MKKIALLFFALPLFTSCSVIMASNRAGIDIDAIQCVRTRTEIIALGAEPVLSEVNEQGELVETYRILKEKGSLSRAILHGILDIGSGFLWEFAGTPIESALSQKKFYSVKATYTDSERIKKMELL